MRREPSWRAAFVSCVLVAGLTACGPTEPADVGFSVVEASISEVQGLMENGELTSRELVTAYLVRIALYEDRLNAVVAINENALAEADALDAERAAGNVRGPLHGIPVALKDNIQTTHLPTTGGALAFEGYMPPYEATLTTNLREAGAIIVAKAGLTEFANFMAGSPDQMPGNYNALTGFAYNPYDPRRDPREGSDGRPVLSTGGSSSGIGTAASFWAANVGTDTGGSVISPSNANMLVGIRPTLGRVSRWGIAPVTLDHDMAGPMARTVADAAIMLGTMESAGPDANDAATGVCEPPPGRDYRPFLRVEGLEGARIGIPRGFYYEPVELNNGRTVGGLRADQARLMADAIAVLEERGAVVVDPADVPSLVDPEASSNFAMWTLCVGGEQSKGADESCSVNFKYGMKRDFNAWLASLGPSAPVKTLTELREWNLAHADAGAMKYRQSRFDISDEMDVEGDRARNEADMVRDELLSRTRGLDAVLEQHQLDAILTPGSRGAGLAARAGYPIIVVPFGSVENRPARPFPEGFDAEPAPFGVGFTGAVCSEPRLIEIAYAFEQATMRRVAPRGFR